MPKRSSQSTRILTTVLATDIVDSTKLATKLGGHDWQQVLHRYHTLLRTLLKRYGGREIDTADDGVLGIFDVPASALQCALDASEKVRELGFKLRAGVHAGECELTETGIAGHVASRIAALAAPGEVLATNIVEGLVTGSGLSFSARGEHSLKGVRGKWSLFTVKKKRASPRASKQNEIRIMLVDDHPMWRDTLRKVVEGNRLGKVAGEAGDGEEAVALAKKLKPEVVLMDIDLPVMNGIESTRNLLRAVPGVKVLMLAGSDERSRVVDAVRAGASGYLLKTAKSAEVVDAVRRVHLGELVFPPAFADMLLEELRAPPGEGRRTKRLRLAIADSSVLFRQGLARVLGEADFEIVGEVGEVDDLLELVHKDPPDLVIIDRRLAPSQTDRAIRTVDALRGFNPEVGILILSQEVDPSSALELLSGGTAGIGYLLKDRVSNVDQLAETIRRVANGESVVDPEVASGLSLRHRERKALDELTSRERDILALMVEGRSNQAICEQLFLAPKTVEGHISHIFTKLGLEPAGDDHRRVLAVLTYLRSV